MYSVDRALVFAPPADKKVEPTLESETMKSTRAARLFMFSLLLLIGGSLVGTYHFFSRLNENYILLSSGYEPEKKIIDPYKYTQSKKGLIFALSAVAACGSFFLMVILPEEGKQKRKEAAPAQPSAVLATEVSAPVKPQPALAEAPVSQKEEEVEHIDADAIEAFEEGLTEVTEGEEDVVYGTADITTAAIVDFVHKFPDSALKFLYRKQLDGKPLTTEEEEIYHSWEKRGMTRGKVKAYILTMMDWDNIPKEAMYDIWKKLRDHIYENLS